MKREFLEGLDLGEGVKLPKAAVDAIMAEHGKDLEGVRQAAKDWEAKHAADTQALWDQLEAVKYGQAVEKAVSGLSFTSESAKKAFVSDLQGKKLPLQEDGKLQGLEDFTRAYREADPGAFTPEDEGKTPIITRGGTAGGSPMGGNDALRAAFGLNTDKN